MRVCSVQSCGRLHYGRGVCQKHYDRLRKYGDPLGVAPIKIRFAQQPPPLELAWAAGLFEGEGTVRINKATKQNLGSLCVSVVNTDKQIIDWFQSRWPGYMKPATGLGPRQRPAWVWITAARKAAEFLMAIRPFIVRDRVKERIQVGIDFQNAKSRTARWLTGDEREQYVEAQWAAWMYMCHLNQRGVPDPDADEWRKRR